MDLMNTTLSQLGNSMKTGLQSKMPVGVTDFMKGSPQFGTIMGAALPALSAIGTSIPNYNEAIMNGENPIGTLPWGTMGGAGSGALLGLLFSKLLGIPMGMGAANGALLGTGLGGTIDSIRNGI